MYLPKKEEFASRRKEIAQAVFKYTIRHFASDGSWTGPPIDQGMREYMWYAMAFLEEGSEMALARANQLIQKNIPDYRLCHFLPLNCLETLYYYETKLEQKTIRLLDDYVQKHLPFFMTQELDFVGANDNFPCMASALLVMASQRYDRPDYLERARKRLRQLIEMLDRRAFTSEYTSPTYTPIQVLALAEIVNFSQDPDTRKMALYAEQRILADLLMHLHWPTAQLAGAFSRGYPVDVVACTHHARFLYFMLYGHDLSVGPMETVFASEAGLAGTVMHHGDGYFLKISAMWQAMPDYHCPAEIWSWARNKQYPYICAGTSESGNSKDSPIRVLQAAAEPLPEFYENPAKQNHQYTYMVESYAIGTARYALHDGYQSQNLKVLYKKKPEVRSQRDIGSMFMRYVVNDHQIDWGTDSSSYDMGKSLCQQKENTAVALYFPAVQYNEHIHSLKLAVCFAALYGPPDEVWLGRQRVTGEQEAAGKEVVFIRDGDVYFMLYPLSPAAIKIEIRQIEKLLEISFVNYRGETKNFTREELFTTGNGVAVEVRSKEEVGSFARFREMMAPLVHDQWYADARKCRYENAGRALEFEYAPRSQSLRFISQNNRRVAEPRFYSSDQEIASLFEDYDIYW